mgnify:CR=1 FL=1
MVEWGELYIEYREKNEDMDENLNQVNGSTVILIIVRNTGDGKEI